MSMSAGAARTSGGRRKRRRPVSDINVTPLVDVMLVLLVIFIVTAPMMKEAIDVDLPRAKGGSGAARQSVSPFVVAVDQDGKVHVGNKTLEPSQLAAQLPGLLSGHEKETVTLKAYRRLPYETAVQVMSIIRASGITAINIAVDAPAGER